MRRACRWLSLLAGALAVVSGAPARGDGWQRLEHPIDPNQQTALAFCDRSHWLQPWRAYIDTRPVSSLRRAVGINLNVPPDELEATAALLAANGVHRVRIEFGWGLMSYEHPTRLANRARILSQLRVLHRYKLRPLILLNANSYAPGPTRRDSAFVTLPGLIGARTLTLDPASAAAVVPGLTGLVVDDRADGVIFTGVDGNTVTLSRPLPYTVLPGPNAVTTLRFEPFGRPLTASGMPNPTFETTLRGWLAYVGAVTRTARSALGSGRFDVEVWNELTFGSEFLDAANYYDPVPDAFTGGGDVTDVLLRRTVSFLRRPGHGLSAMGIGDGFTNQTPFPSGATAPAGLTALDKHPYSGPRTVFGAPVPRRCRPLDALGQPAGHGVSDGDWLDDFTPSYVDYFPEYYLTAIQTEHYIRDLSPITTSVGPIAHGRFTHPSGGPPPKMWITETGMAPDVANLVGAAAEHMLAKATLRTLVAFVSKGAAMVDIYTAKGNRFGLIDPAFFDRGGSGGEAITAIGRLLGNLGHGHIAHQRALTLLAIDDRGTHAQFEGDGTAAHPTLWDRDVVAAFPFQASNHRFVVATYVMTRDVSVDLPAAPFRLVLGGLRGRRVTVSAYDPLTGKHTPARVVRRAADRVTIELDLTDSPRLLHISDAHAPTPPRAAPR